MSSFPILDLVAGMIFIYFLLSIICSSAVEMILTGLNLRASLLEEWLTTIFDKQVTQPDGTKINLGQAIMDHCSTTALSKPGKSTSYVDAKNFTSALIEKVTYDPNNAASIATDIDSMIGYIKTTQVLSTELQRVLLSYAYEAKNTYAAKSKKAVSELDLFRSKVEAWYNSSMDRVTGTLKKRWARPFTFAIALVIAASLNADSISIAKYLYNNPEARAKIAAEAYAAPKDSAFIRKVEQLKIPIDTSMKDNSPATLQLIKDSITEKLAELNRANGALQAAIPLGWRKGEMVSDDNTSSGLALLWLSKIIGLMGTMLAMVMGAPFWFDILNKIANLRGAGTKPASAAPASDDDRK